jgi:hypothetical protein
MSRSAYFSVALFVSLSVISTPRHAAALDGISGPPVDDPLRLAATGEPVVLTTETPFGSGQTPSADLVSHIAAAGGCYDSMAMCETYCRDSCGFYAGCEALFAKPHLKESFKAINIDVTTGQQLIGFSHGYDLSPRVWLGYQSADGLGVRTRYWQYDHGAPTLTLASGPFNAVSAQAITVIFPGVIASDAPGQLLTVTNGLAVQTIDLEATQALAIGSVEGRVGVGLRYAKLRQTFVAAILDAGVPDQLLSTEREFEGFGPFLSADFRRPLGCTGFSGLVVVSGGVFFGNKSMFRFVDNNLDDPEMLPIIVVDQVDEVTGMGEMSFGLEWTGCTRWGQFFARGMYGAQLWTDAGAPTLTYMGFEGLSVSVGANF